MFIPKYQLTEELVKSISLYESSRAVVDYVSLNPAWEAKLAEETLIKMVYASVTFDGGQLSEKEVAKIIRLKPKRGDSAFEIASKAMIMGKERDVQEVINLSVVIEYIREVMSKGDEMNVDIDLLKRIHSMLNERLVNPVELGEFRKQHVVIKNKDGEILLLPPYAIEVSFQIEDFLLWLNNLEFLNMHPLVKAAISLYELNRIHPFLEQNGKVARVISLMLLAMGRISRKFYAVEEYFIENLSEYYECIRQVEASNDLTAFVEFYARGLVERVVQVESRVREVVMNQAIISRSGQQVPLSERQIKILEELEKTEWLTMVEARLILPTVSDDTILRDFKDLMDKRLIRKMGRTKGAKYGLRL